MNGVPVRPMNGSLEGAMYGVGESTPSLSPHLR